jgi:hypothetical protein
MVGQAWMGLISFVAEMDISSSYRLRHLLPTDRRIFMKKKKSRIPKSVWGYRGCPGKGGKTQNSKITENDSTKEKESK